MNVPFALRNEVAKMVFVRSAQEIKEIEDLLAEGRFTTESVTVDFTTTREFARSVLAPCFEVPDEPTGYANVSRWQSAYCGEFDCGIVAMRCKYKGQDGAVMLLLVTSGDTPNAVGREMWGCAEKGGTACIYFDGADSYSYSARNGTRLIEIDAKFGPDRGPQPPATNMTFELKAQIHTLGRGLQHPVIISGLLSKENYRAYREGTATLKFNGNAFDPLNEIPVVSVGTAYYAEGEWIWTTDFWEELPDTDAYKPFIFGQKYDDLRLFHRPMRHAQK
jgi:acetoacetate decarboxylase